jgi:uncharacterized membrane protein YphA (DoxX/SURF4 family)
VVEIAASHSTSLIRISLATVFIWFGLLKIIGHSPVTEIVAQTMQWLPAPTGLLMLLLGVLEMALGLGLLFGRGAVLRVILIVFLLHLSGTLLVLAQTDIAFQMGNPLLLTTEGEFVIKNLVMITAGLVLLGSTRRAEVDAAAKEAKSPLGHWPR